MEKFGEHLANKLGIAIDPVLLDNALMHASYPEQNETQRKINKAYMTIGKHILDACALMNVYINKPKEALAPNTQLVYNMSKLAASRFYNNYHLESLIYKDKGDMDKTHEHVTLQVIYALFSSLGFLYVYRLFNTLIQDCESIEEHDYKSSLIEYATKRNQTCVFSIVSETGPAHEKEFTSRVQVGNLFAIGNGRTKKQAEKSASENFSKQYKIFGNSASNSREQSGIKSFPHTRISQFRANQLYTVYNFLGVSDEYIKEDELNVAFTHRSMRGSGADNLVIQTNMDLKMIGSFFVQILARECVLASYDIDSIDVMQTFMSTCNNECLISSIPENWAEYILAEKSFFTINKKGVDIARLECFESVIGVLIFKSVASRKTIYLDVCRNMVFSLLSLTNNQRVEYYITQFQTVVQDLGVQAELEVVSIDKKVGEASGVFTISYGFRIGTIIIMHKANGNTISEAKNRAAELVLRDYLLYFDAIFTQLSDDRKHNIVKKRKHTIASVISNLSYQTQLYIVSQYGHYLKYLDAQSEEMCLAAISNNPLCIQYVKNQTPSVQISVINSGVERAITMLTLDNDDVRESLIREDPRCIENIPNPSPRIIECYNIQMLSKSKVARKEFAKRGVIPKDELIYNLKLREAVQTVVDSGRYFMAVVDNRVALYRIISELVSQINPVEANIDVGFLVESGLGMLHKTFNFLYERNVTVNLAVGSLQKYYLSLSSKGYLDNFDLGTAQLLNKYLKSKLIILRTYERSFYHGKLYYFRGKNLSFVIIGSSNVSASGLDVNRELNTLFVFNNSDNVMDECVNWHKEFINECVLIDCLDESCFLNSKAITSPQELSRQEMQAKINSLSDLEQQKRLNLWLSKSPTGIYKLNKNGYGAFDGYIAIQYRDNGLCVLESFESGNAFYCFNTGNFNDISEDLRNKTKIQLFTHPLLIKRGYHSSDMFNLMINVNSLF